MLPPINCSAKEVLGSLVTVAAYPPIFCPIAPPITVAELTFAIFFAFSPFSESWLTYPNATAYVPPDANPEIIRAKNINGKFTPNPKISCDIP